MEMEEGLAALEKEAVWRSHQWRIGYRDRPDGGAEVFLLDPDGKEHPRGTLNADDAARFRERAAAGVIRPQAN